MDIDLPEDAVTGINEAMRFFRGNDDDAAGLNFAGVITDGNGRSTFDSECHLDVRMLCNGGPSAGSALTRYAGKDAPCLSP